MRRYIRHVIINTEQISNHIRARVIREKNGRSMRREVWKNVPFQIHRFMGQCPISRFFSVWQTIDKFTNSPGKYSGRVRFVSNKRFAESACYLFRCEFTSIARCMFALTEIDTRRPTL